MATKVKLIGICFFLLILTISFLLETRIFKEMPEKYKEWAPDSVLETNDFLMHPPIFTSRKTAARLNLNLLIIENKRVEAVTLINRNKSWIRKEMYSDNLLRHETYHAKLSEAYLNNLNFYIQEKNLSNIQARSFIKNKIPKWKEIQKVYDIETNHGQIKAQQNYWEYKIDSMLNKSIDFPIFQETENIEVYFPNRTNEFVLALPDGNFNGYKLEKYNVKFWIVDLNMFTSDTSAIEDYWIHTIAAEGHSDIIINRDYNHERAIFESYSKDTIGKEIVLDKLLLGKSTTYWLRNRYPIVEENEELYKRMGDQFFNSFRVIDE